MTFIYYFKVHHEEQKCGQLALHFRRQQRVTTALFLWCHQIRDGRKVCEAHHSTGGRGVYAIARCCTGSSVKCRASASLLMGMDAECHGQEYQLTGTE